MGTPRVTTADLRSQNGTEHVCFDNVDGRSDDELQCDGYQRVTRRNHKRRLDQSEQEATSKSPNSQKRKMAQQHELTVPDNRNAQVTNVTAPAYFNNNRSYNKQTAESSTYQPIHGPGMNDGKRHQRTSFPPFRIRMKDDQYPTRDVTIIKDINTKCNLSLTYGRMSTVRANRCFLLYCNTAPQFEHLLDKSKWPEKICDQEYTFDLPDRIPTSYSAVMLNVSTQWDVESFSEELKSQYKTIVRCARLYVREGRAIPKIRIDFSSYSELREILKNKRMMLDDGHTSYAVEPYVPPPKVLRCYICQEFDSHVAAHCPNKARPICFKCGQQHPYNPDCQNKTCCFHCKGDHMAGNPNCPKKIESRDRKKSQSRAASTIGTTRQPYRGRWADNSAQHLFGNPTATSSAVVPPTGYLNTHLNENSAHSKLLDTIHMNIQSILQQQLDLNKHLTEMNTQLNCQAKEIVNINEVLNEIVCPLLKETTNIIYARLSAQNKRKIDSSYNRLVSYLNQKELDCSLTSILFANKSPTLQSQADLSLTNVNNNPSNES